MVCEEHKNACKHKFSLANIESSKQFPKQVLRM